MAADQKGGAGGVDPKLVREHVGTGRPSVGKTMTDMGQVLLIRLQRGAVGTLAVHFYDYGSEVVMQAKG
eukprot:CAMPEP_0175045880 /NCGR_PEP_ID=MMETSP0052_2-20121109/4704_1 /TAXON_ID=51329 ORGANISM="Polytomella parva, Strain SAG 63-3" /NCGR_SAMPLE_ID=MMETSP0052_2 /ASSEMBLY_ACC=CAM_ASM_000194 /LENGTH=68 /DNA_ID=CAMNT_0016309531 /DNA_START=311 /DNA_END=513 /DNA_ORIENTATION=-